MLRKSIFVLLILVVISMVMIAFRNMHLYYEKHSVEFNRATVYLKSDVCVKGELATQLGDFSKCEDARRIVHISPWVAAWYDFLEDMFVCGHGRCDKFWNEISTKLPYIILFIGFTLCYVAYQSVQAQRMQNAAMYWSLPLQMNPRLGMNRPHLD